MAATTVAVEQLDELRGSFSGRILGPSDDGYDEARRVHNGLIDRRPALIAQCHGAADIADAVRFAQRTGLEVSVRGGGHNVAGLAVADDALVIDLSQMKGIHVDRKAQTARAQGGVIWSELNREIAAHGLATTGGAISTTGIAGLTLGGGLGWLMSKYGLAADNVIEIQLVTADGRIVDVTESSDPDLFWALRGGGGNFGVAASFVYRCHPLTTVVGGLIAHPFERAGEVLRFFRDAIAGASDDLTAFAGVVHAPDGSGMKLAAMILMHTGSEDDAQRELAPFLAWGPPALAEVGPMPWQVMNSLLDDGYPRGALNYWVSSFTDGLSDGLFDTMIDRFAGCPSPMTAIVLEQFHGEVCRVPVDATAVPHRGEGWNLLITGEWLEPGETDVNVAWVRETHAALRPFLSGGRWLNYLGDDQGRDGVRGAYGPNYDRLVELKRKYDPDNVFHHNHNIEP